MHDILLNMIVELNVTMKGFSYASMWMEKFKQSFKNQHSIQRACEGTCMKTILENICMLHTNYKHYVCACVMTYNYYIIHKDVYVRM